MRLIVPTGLFSHHSCFEHITDERSPESPLRIEAIEERLVASGLYQAFDHIESQRKATEADILRAHDESYLSLVKEKTPLLPKEIAYISEDTAICSGSLNAAFESAGCVLDAVDQIMSGKLRNAFCMVRPPGHHAHRNGAGGFCIFNNVAIAALYAVEVLKLKHVVIIDFDAHMVRPPGHHAHRNGAGGFCIFNNVAIAALYAVEVLKLKHVVIIDFDAHHGDGTEDIVKNRKDIDFFSLFQEGIFPHVGGGFSANNIHNEALSPGATGDEACEIIRNVWEPIIQKLQPELILISAGFDAHANEVMAQLDFSDLDYAHMTRIIDDIAHAVCQGRIVSVLEGGYERRSLARSVIAHIRTLAHL